MITIFFAILIISLFLIILPSAFSLDYDPGPGGEMLLKPIQQGDRPWALGSYSEIDDMFRDDSDFIQSAPIGKSGQDLVDFKFSPGLDAHQDYDHILRIVFKEGDIGTNNLHLTLTLKQEGQIIEEWTYYPVPSTFTLDEHTISSVNVAKISDYSNLWITIRAWCDLTCASTTGSKDVIQISWLDFSYHRTRSDESNLTPSLIGIGIYQIETQNVTKPYSENTMKDNDAGVFSTYHPYSKLSDETDILRYGQITEYEKFGTFFFVADSKKFFPITSGVINRPVQIQILVHDDFQSERVEHVELSGVITKQDSKKNAHLFEIDLEKGKNTVVHDDYGIFKDVFTSWSVEDGYLWANIDLVFEKILPKSDFVIQIWDQERITKKYELFEIFEVSKTNELILDKEINLTSNVMIIHDASSPICKIHSQCFMPFNAQILETGIVTWTNYDETVHSVVGGSDAPNNRFSYYVFPGKSIQHRFDISGVYNYYCDLHPWAKGKVTVINQSNKIPTIEKTELAPIIIYSITSSGSLLVDNNDLVIKDNHNMWFEVTGNLSENIGKSRVELVIISPDNSKKIIHSSVNDRGYYRVPVLLNERWMPGEYTIISKVGSVEVGKVTFTVKS
jgi:hypothetical protein